MEVDGPRHAPRPGLLSRHGTGVLTLVARIENESVATLARGEETFASVRQPLRGSGMKTAGSGSGLGRW